MVTDVRYTLSKCSKYLLAEKWNYMVLRDFSYNKHARQNGYLWGMSDCFLALLGAPMVTDGASMVPVGRYAFLESSKGLVTVKNRNMR